MDNAAIFCTTKSGHIQCVFICRTISISPGFVSQRNEWIRLKLLSESKSYYHQGEARKLEQRACIVGDLDTGDVEVHLLPKVINEFACILYSLRLRLHYKLLVVFSKVSNSSHQAAVTRVLSENCEITAKSWTV